MVGTDLFNFRHRYLITGLKQSGLSFKDKIEYHQTWVPTTKTYYRGMALNSSRTFI